MKLRIWCVVVGVVMLAALAGCSGNNDAYEDGGSAAYEKELNEHIESISDYSAKIDYAGTAYPTRSNWYSVKIRGEETVITKEKLEVVYDTLSLTAVDNTAKVLYGVNPNKATYTWYNEKYEIVQETSETFTVPTTAGIYYLIIDAMWGGEKEADKIQFFAKLDVKA